MAMFAPTTLRVTLIFATLAGLGAFGRAADVPDRRAKKPFVRTEHYETRTVVGWTVRVNKDLLGEQAELGAKALHLLEIKLDDIARTLPPKAVEELRKVPIWLGVDDGSAPCAEYHPGADWLRENGYNPEKAKGVEIGNAGRFIEWSKGQPWMIFHELAHAYHDRVLGFDDERIPSAYKAAVESKKYDDVLHANGRTERAYALTDVTEYFAEASEAFFGVNDFYPFVRAELKRHDPKLEALLGEVWGVGK